MLQFNENILILIMKSIKKIYNYQQIKLKIDGINKNSYYFSNYKIKNLKAIKFKI